MIGSRAQRPGDIIRHKNGKFIQVDNTDAEGRLCLIVGLARAGEVGAETIVDIATLTGACIRALGTSLAGVIGNDEALVGSLVAIGEKSGECLWPFPLLKEYKKELETPHADLRTIGNGNAGQITAALVMQPFVPKKAKWAHLDIAGPAYFEKGWKYYSPGATGFGTQLFVDWVQSISQSQ
jgi:leucyl aminopeptidase